MKHLLRIGPIALWLLAGPLHAAEQAPSAKPVITATAALKSAVEYHYFRKAMRAASAGAWNEMRSYRAGVTTPAAQELLLWRLAVEDGNAGFFELKEAVETLKDWPRSGKIRAKAEKTIAKSGLDDAHIIAYFDTWPALTGTGRLAFAKALSAQGFAEKAKDQIRLAWRNNTLSSKQEHEILKVFGGLLSTQDHMERADAMIWGRHRSSARRMLAHLKGADRAVISARLALMRNGRNLDAALRRVPTARMHDAGLLYERAHWRRRHGLAGEARQLVLLFPKGSYSKEAARRMWVERRLAALRAIKDDDYDSAYKLVAAHGLIHGANFARAEWLAGWLALRKLNSPKQALAHFTALKAGVSTPVSLARANYWIGRAATTLGDDYTANAAFREASGYNFTYYGQLAAQHFAEARLSLTHDPQPTAQQRANFTGNVLVQALKLIAQVGDERLFRTFSYYLDDILPRSVDHVMLAGMARQMGQDRAAIRAAKAALWRGEVLPDSAWPMISLPDTLPVEKALALAVARQESELDARVVSHAGARGLLQLMPATARHAARNTGRAYRKSWLTDDPQYNISLGAAHLNGLLQEFDGSYILAVAAYNAGKHRVHQWIKDYGDPRNDVDPVDWVESIPFSETRNYVQRVMENVQVYRQRLAGQPIPFSLQNDLERGANS